MTTRSRWTAIFALGAALLPACSDSARAPKTPQGVPGAASAIPELPWAPAFDFRTPRAAAKTQVPPSVLDAEARIPGCEGSGGNPVVDDVIDGDFLGTGKPVQVVLINRRAADGSPGAPGTGEVKSALVAHEAGKVLFALRVPDTIAFGGTFPIARSRGAKTGLVLTYGRAVGGECSESARFVELSATGPAELRKVDDVANCATGPAACSRPKGRVVQVRVNADQVEFRETPVPWNTGDPCAAGQPAPIPSGGPPPPAHS